MAEVKGQKGGRGTDHVQQEITIAWRGLGSEILIRMIATQCKRLLWDFSRIRVKAPKPEMFVSRDNNLIHDNNLTGPTKINGKNLFYFLCSFLLQCSLYLLDWKKILTINLNLYSAIYHGAWSNALYKKCKKKTKNE